MTVSEAMARALMLLPELNGNDPAMQGLALQWMCTGAATRQPYLDETFVVSVLGGRRVLLI